MAVKLVSNPPNPYLSQYSELLGPAPAVKVEVYEETAASILSENDSPDIPFRWSANPYRGCQHACAYCYARPYHEYLGMGAGTDFDTKLVAKVNAAELLRKEIAADRRRREQAETRSTKRVPVDSICFSGVTDCYQPLEAVYRLTRSCLEVCLDFRMPVSIVTKSYLIMRDAHLLASLGRAAGAVVYQSIPFSDDKLARLIEPQAPPPSRRFEAMRRLTAAGVAVGVMVAPIIPGLNDKEIPAVLRRAAESGASFAGYTALRLPGSVESVFLERLRSALPLRAGHIESRIREMRGGKLNDSRFGSRMTGEGEYWQSIRSLFSVSAARFGLVSGERSAGRIAPVNSPAGRISTAPSAHPAADSSQLRFDFS